jgi:SNF2 family DNA or RNA helicase
MQEVRFEVREAGVTKFIPGGPKRYPHQIRGLKKLIETAGIGALLFDPGLGKTATTLDFLGILALKTTPDDHGVQEVRVLVVCPLAAVDTWVKQAATWMSPQVNYWAEALGGSIQQRSEALAARGGSPITRKGKRTGMRTINGVRMQEPKRAEGWQRSIDWGARSDERRLIGSDGPDGVGKLKPRVIIEVLNLDTFASRQRSGSKTMADVVLDGVKRYNPQVVIVDESHKIKSATSNVSRLMDRVGQNSKRRIILTGTVMPAGPLDVFGQWRFLDPYAFGETQPDGSIKKMTFDSFKRRFAVMGGYMGHEVIGYRNLDELQEIMGYRAIVARKADSLDLPPVIPIIVPVMLSAKEKDVYQQMKKSLATQLSSGVLASAPNKLSQMMRLRQITSGHLPDDMGIVHEIGTSKVDTIKSIAHDTLIGEKRIVIFCLFTFEFQMLMEKMQDKGTIVLGISGATHSDDRLRIRARFGSDEDVRIILVAQIRTISLAVNELVTASHVIFGSLSQQRDDLIQGIDRLHRIGQTGTVTAWFAEAPGTIDTVIHATHDDRTDLESAVLRHIMSDDFENHQPDPPISDPRIPGLSSISSDAVNDAIGIFTGGNSDEQD